MKINQLKAGVILNYISQAISILTGLLYTPVMLRFLGQSEYGLYQLVFSVVSYLSLLSLGFGAGYVRFYSRYKADGSSEQIARLNGMYMTVFGTISLICLFLGSLLVFKIDSVFGSGLTPAELDKARVLMGLMVINISLTFINSVFSNNITVHERFFFHRGVNLIHIVLNPFVTLPLLFLGLGSVAITVVNTVFTVAILVVNIFYCIKNLKMKFSFTAFDWSLMKEIWTFTVFVFIMIIVERINVNMGKFLLGRLEGTVSVAVYGVASQINILYINFSTAISCMFIPRVNFIVSENRDEKELSVLFSKVGRIQFLVICLIVSGFVIYGREFIDLWAGEGYAGSYWVCVILMVSNFIPLVQNLGLEIQKAKNLHKVSAVVLLIVAVANVFISIPLIRMYSYIGAAIGTALVTVVGNVLFMNWYYYKKIGLDIWHFWKEILKFAPALMASAICGELVRRFLLPGAGFAYLAANILVYCVIFVVFFWLFGMNDFEKNLIKKPIGGILRKLKRKA